MFCYLPYFLLKHTPLTVFYTLSLHDALPILLVTNTPPGTLEPQVKRALAEADPNLTVTSVRTLEEQVERSFDQQRAVASLDRKSTRLNSSHLVISYAVFCLKKKKRTKSDQTE